MKRILPLLVALALATSACGLFGSNKPTPTTLLGEGDGVGAGLTTPTTAAAAVTTAKPTVTAAGFVCPHKDPTSEIEYGGRVRIALTVSKLCPSRAEDITLSMKVTNISGAAFHYDKNQAQFFSMLAYPSGSGRLRWEDTSCQPPSRDRNAPAGTINPGESVNFSTLYPAPKSVADREKCRRLQSGGYQAKAVFLVCDGDAYTDGYCDISKDTQFQAEPVLMTVVD
ncbi:MAG: hypothetical protein QOI61_822 [Actinomycetota bacterium]